MFLNLNIFFFRFEDGDESDVVDDGEEMNLF
jgi:hypothetical protein